jgi:hypothetical protein
LPIIARLIYIYIYKLLQGRIEGFFGNQRQTEWLLKTLSLTTKITTISTFVKTPIPVHIIISKKSAITDKAGLLLKLDTMLQTIYQEIYFKKLMVAPH